MKSNKGFTLIELLIIISILGIITAIVFSGGGFSRSDGDRVGSITKFSHKGIFWTTWEGELVMGGVNKSGGNTVANVWEFSVVDETLVQEIRKAMDLDKPVKLHYKQVLLLRPWNGSTTYFVDSIAPVGQ